MNANVPDIQNPEEIFRYYRQTSVFDKNSGFYDISLKIFVIPIIDKLNVLRARIILNTYVFFRFRKVLPNVVTITTTARLDFITPEFVIKCE